MTEIIGALFGAPVVAFILWRVAYKFRTPEYDRWKKKHPDHFL